MKKLAILLFAVLTLSLALPASMLAANTPKTQQSKVVVQPIDINNASSEELQIIPGIGVTLAERIIAYRSKHGAFKNAEQLTAVRGIGEKSLAKLRPWIKIK